MKKRIPPRRIGQTAASSASSGRFSASYLNNNEYMCINPAAAEFARGRGPTFDGDEIRRSEASGRRRLERLHPPRETKRKGKCHDRRGEEISEQMSIM